MAILKFKDKGEWKSIAAFKGEDGKDGAIQYKAGAGINISDDNIISATFSGDDGVDITVDSQPLPDSTNPVASGGVYTALQDKADKSEIKTDTSELTNGAGFITGNDIPKDLGDFKNEAGFLTEESDPLFSRSPAASITNADKTLWNGVADLHICPLIYNSNYSDTSSFTITSTTILNKLKSYIDKYGVWGTAIYLVTNHRADLYIPVRSAVTGTTTSGTNEWSYKAVKAQDSSIDIMVSRLVVVSKRSDGTYTRIEVGAHTVATVSPSSVLKKTNTTAYTPTEAYHPATKQYVDDQVAAGVEGIGGIEVEEDPIFMKSIASTITEDDITRWNNKADSGGIEFEEDPSVPTWVKGITEDDISNWNNKADTSGISDTVGNLLEDKYYLSVNTGIVLEVDAAFPLTDYLNFEGDWTDYGLYYNHSYTSAKYAQIYATIQDQLAKGIIPSIILKHNFAGDDWDNPECAVILLQYSPNKWSNGSLVFAGMNPNYTVNNSNMPYSVSLVFESNNTVNISAVPLIELSDLRENLSYTPIGVDVNAFPWNLARSTRCVELSNGGPLTVIMQQDGLRIKSSLFGLMYKTYNELKQQSLREESGTLNTGETYKSQDYIIAEAVINKTLHVTELNQTDSGYELLYPNAIYLNSSDTLGFHNDDIDNGYYLFDYGDDYVKPAFSYNCTVTSSNYDNYCKVICFTVNVGKNKDKPLKLRLELGTLVNSHWGVQTKSCIRLHLDNWIKEIEDPEEGLDYLREVHAYSDTTFANDNSYIYNIDFDIFIPTPILLNYNSAAGIINGYRDETI